MTFCYGIIPLRRTQNTWFVLLVHHQKGHWGLPKGHPEPHELPEMTAQRELCEETGLQVERFLLLPVFEEHYTVDHQPKTVQYYAAFVTGQEKRQVKEIKALKWVPLQDAMDHVTFVGNQTILQDVAKILIQKPDVANFASQ